MENNLNNNLSALLAEKVMLEAAFAECVSENYENKIQSYELRILDLQRDHEFDKAEWKREVNTRDIKNNYLTTENSVISSDNSELGCALNKTRQNLKIANDKITFAVNKWQNMTKQNCVLQKKLQVNEVKLENTEASLMQSKLEVETLNTQKNSEIARLVGKLKRFEVQTKDSITQTARYFIDEQLEFKLRQKIKDISSEKGRILNKLWELQSHCLTHDAAYLASLSLQNSEITKLSKCLSETETSLVYARRDVTAKECIVKNHEEQIRTLQNIAKSEKTDWDGTFRRLTTKIDAMENEKSIQKCEYDDRIKELEREINEKKSQIQHFETLLKDTEMSCRLEIKQFSEQIKSLEYKYKADLLNKEEDAKRLNSKITNNEVAYQKKMVKLTEEFMQKETVHFMEMKQKEHFISDLESQMVVLEDKTEDQVVELSAEIVRLRQELYHDRRDKESALKQLDWEKEVSVKRMNDLCIRTMVHECAFEAGIETKAEESLSLRELNEILHYKMVTMEDTLNELKEQISRYRNCSNVENEIQMQMVYTEKQSVEVQTESVDISYNFNCDIIVGNCAIDKSKQDQPQEQVCSTNRTLHLSDDFVDIISETTVDEGDESYVTDTIHIGVPLGSNGYSNSSCSYFSADQTEVHNVGEVNKNAEDVTFEVNPMGDRSAAILVNTISRISSKCSICGNDSSSSSASRIDVDVRDEECYHKDGRPVLSDECRSETETGEACNGLMSSDDKQFNEGRDYNGIESIVIEKTGNHSLKVNTVKSVENMLEEITEKTGLIRNLETDLNNARETIKVLKDNNEVLTNQIDFLETKISDKEQMLRTTSSMRADLLLSVSKLQQEVCERQSGTSSNEDEITDLKRRLEKKEKDYSRLQTKYQKEIQTLQSRLEVGVGYGGDHQGQGQCRLEGRDAAGDTDPRAVERHLRQEIVRLDDFLKSKEDHIDKLELEMTHVRDHNELCIRRMEQHLLESSRIHQADIEGLNSYHEGQKSRELAKLKKELTEKMETMQASHETSLTQKTQQGNELEKMVTSLQHQNEQLRNELQNYFLLNADPNRFHMLQERIGIISHRAAGIGERYNSFPLQHRPSMVGTPRTDFNHYQPVLSPHTTTVPTTLTTTTTITTNGATVINTHRPYQATQAEVVSEANGKTIGQQSTAISCQITATDDLVTASSNYKLDGELKREARAITKKETREGLPGNIQQPNTIIVDNSETNGRWQTWKSYQSLPVTDSKSIQPLTPRPALLPTPPPATRIALPDDEQTFSSRNVIESPRDGSPSASVTRTPTSRSDTGNDTGSDRPHSPATGTISDSDTVRILSSGNESGKNKRKPRGRNKRRKANTEFHS